MFAMTTTQKLVAQLENVKHLFSLITREFICSIEKLEVAADYHDRSICSGFCVRELYTLARAVWQSVRLGARVLKHLRKPIL